MNGLRAARKAMEMSQKELADKCGVPQSVISLLETYDIEAGGGLLSKINGALGTEYYDDMKGDKKMSQAKRVLEYMEKHGSISQAEAISAFSCYRLAAKIFDLRKEGYVIKTERVPFSNEYTNGYYAVYSLVGGKP